MRSDLPRRWAWCLPCGFAHIVPYFYVIYFGALLGKARALMTSLLVVRYILLTLLMRANQFMCEKAC